MSWILRNITDPGALDVAIRLAGTIRWFEDGADVVPPYDLVVSAFHGCFDPNGNVYPGSRDRAYYSARAVIWIRTRAMCKSQGFAQRFPPLAISRTTPAPDRDFEQLLAVNSRMSDGFGWWFDFDPRHTPSHSQWISDVLLHCSWASRTTLWTVAIWINTPRTGETAVPLDTTLNRLLMWCISIGSPVEEDALKVQDKS